MSDRERTLKEYRDHIAKLRRPPPPPHDPARIPPWRRRAAPRGHEPRVRTRP